jgi:hypothetical protein
MVTKCKFTKKSLKSEKNSESKIKKDLKGKVEEVVKVKLNTGILYLYKGIHLRAFFMRTI